MGRKQKPAKKKKKAPHKGASTRESEPNTEEPPQIDPLEAYYRNLKLKAKAEDDDDEDEYEKEDWLSLEMTLYLEASWGMVAEVLVS